MTYDFKLRNGVQTCEPCGRDAQGYCASSKTKGGCLDANCPFKNPDDTPSAFARRVEELKAKYDLW